MTRRISVGANRAAVGTAPSFVQTRQDPGGAYPRNHTDSIPPGRARG